MLSMKTQLKPLDFSRCKEENLVFSSEEDHKTFNVYRQDGHLVVYMNKQFWFSMDDDQQGMEYIKHEICYDFPF